MFLWAISFPPTTLPKKSEGLVVYPPPKQRFWGGIERLSFIIFWLNVLKKKSRNLEQKLSSEKNSYGHRRFYGFRIEYWKKKFSSFLYISHKASDDACKVLSKGSYPHAKNPENFFLTTQSQRVLFGLKWLIYEKVTSQMGLKGC